MKASGALTQDDVTKILLEKTPTEQVDKLIEVLMRKPESAYTTFMNALQEERPDLYRQVKTIESELMILRCL